MTLVCESIPTVAYAVSSHSLRFPIFGMGNCARNSGNFARKLASGAEFHGFLLQNRFQKRKPEVSSWFPAWFPSKRGSA